MKKKGLIMIILSIVAVVIVLVPLLFILSNASEHGNISGHENATEHGNTPESPLDRNTKSVSEEPAQQVEEPVKDSIPDYTADHEDLVLPEDIEDIEEEKAPPEETIFALSEADPELTAVLDDIASRYDCIAVSLVVYNGESRDYYTYQYGYADISDQRPVDADTKFRVASLSKLIVVICAMTLVEEGKLDLDADISDYLGYEVRNPEFPDVLITPRMLMQHTSSIYDSNAYSSAGNRNSVDTAKRLLDSGSCYGKQQPGSNYRYSNFGYAILGLICEILSGKRFDTLARDILFDPLGIDAAYLPLNLREDTNIAAIYNRSHVLRRSVEAQINSGDQSEQGSDHNQTPGNLMISVIDYAKVLTMLGNGGTIDGIRILSSDSVQSIHNADTTGKGYKQGLATRLQNDPDMPESGSYWHTGSAWGTFAQYNYYVSGDENRGVVVVTTGANTGRLENGMVEVCIELSVSALKATSQAHPASSRGA